MKKFLPIRELPQVNGYKSGDVLVVFGELFSRGYVNGLIEEALKKDMKVITATVGRRDSENNLRPLNAEELAEKNFPVINLPLEAGFDLDSAKDGTTACDQLKGYKLSQWQNVTIDWDKIEESQLSGEKRFRKTTQNFLSQIETMIPENANVLFAHTMAGGFPRAKIVMPAMNRVVKGSGDRYAASKVFWDSQIGQLCSKSFDEVTANTLRYLIEESTQLRQKIEARGNNVSYTAYGYHGTEILIDGEYKWQSYSPYLQGWAKVKLEDIASEFFDKGVKVCVFNAPEILTNSSSIFLGVEIPLYNLLAAFQKERPDAEITKKLTNKCASLLKEEFPLNDVLDNINSYFTNSIIQDEWSDFPNWPQHNGQTQMDLMRGKSQEIIKMHKDEKQLMTTELSEVIFKACGQIMFTESWDPKNSAWWMGHDLIAKIAK